ncbi:uncharacterized protein LOC119075900 [Bradysia coprophila]|uniref:uncharacterized protein LOC119075900 n=1 Tax=Bradysia coprophila TaxID=38358 RepID=UPI00187D81ED|nr:uncharacterized protein LOC119075900 [Bradysia coprophila]
MLMLKLFFVAALLYETTEASKIQTGDKKVSFSVEKIWQNHKKNDDMCYDDNRYVQSVQEYYTGCREVSWMFRGPSYCIADNVMISMESLITKLLYFANTNSTVLASSAADIFESMSKCKRLKTSCLIIISEFNKVLPRMVKDFNGVVEAKLSNYIGDVSVSFSDAVVDLSDEFSNFMGKYLQCSASECKGKVDYKPVFKKCQRLMNTVALIAETIMNDCEPPTREHFEAVTILSLIFCYFSIAVQGINSCVQDQLYGDEHPVPKDIESISTSLDFVVVEAHQAIFTIDYPFEDKMNEMLITFVDITLAFNKAIKDILGVFEGVATTRGEILKNLSKCCKKLDPAALNDRTNIVKGIVSE